MPLVKISMIEGRTDKEKHAIMNVVHKALVESFKIPEKDRNIRIEEYEKGDYLLPPDRSEGYVLIEITAFSGRSIGAKRLLYRIIVDRLKMLGIDAMDIVIVIYEGPLENWGIRGGIPACDFDLGFNVNV